MPEVNYHDKVWDEILATKIFYLIHTGEVSYASGIAKKTGKNNQTIKNYINGLVSRDLVFEKERVSGKIIYDSDIESLSEEYYDLIIQETQNKANEHEYLENEDIVTEYREVIKNLKNDTKTRIKSTKLIENYINKIFDIMEFNQINRTLNELLFFEFSFSLNSLYYHRSELFDEKEWLTDFYRGVIYSQIQGWSGNILSDVIEDMED